MKQQSFKDFAKQIRILCLETIHRSKSSHIGSSLSVADVLAVLYGKILKARPKSPEWEDRDRFILSKGHGALALYVTLALKKFFPVAWLATYYQNKGRLMGHATSHGVPGVEVSTGSLGHGLPVGCGMALAAKRDRKNYRVFVVLSDGEMDEGSNWESILFAPHHKLDNLTVVVDYNKIQSLTWVKATLNIEPFIEKWKAFGWSVREIDGHNFQDIEKALVAVPFEKGKPSCIIAHTVKGKGVSFMENKIEWHYKYPDADQLVQAVKELEKQ